MKNLISRNVIKMYILPGVYGELGTITTILMNNGLNPCMATGQGCGSYSGQQWGKSLVTGHVISGWGVHNGLYHWPLVMCDTWVWFIL